MLNVHFFTGNTFLAGNADVAATHGFHPQRAGLLTVLHGDQIHGVGMGFGQLLLGEDNFRGYGGEYFQQNPVGAVANTGLAERTVKDHLESVCLRVLTAEQLGCPLGAHGVGRRGAFADLVDFFNGLHLIFLHFIIIGHIIANPTENYNGVG